MNKHKLALALPGLGLLVLFSAFSLLYPGGAPAGYSGSPADAKNCFTCHGGTVSTVAGIISSDVDTAGYFPGQTYNFLVSVPGSGSKGFEVSPQNLNGDLIGSLVPGINTQIKSIKYLTHVMTSGGDPTSWTFQWTAPSKGSGDVTFYGAFAAGKYNTLLSTLTVKENTSCFVNEQNGFCFRIYPNPVTIKFILSFSLYKNSMVSAEIISLDGKTAIKLFQINLEKGKNDLQVNWPENLREGVYFIRCSTEGKSVVRTVTKF